MILRLFCNIKRLIISLLLLSGFYASIFSQTKITAPIINDYGRVTSIGTGSVIVSDPVEFSNFQAGDTVLLIQMKGAMCTVPQDANYGILQMYVGTTGGYEFLTVFSVDGGTNKITFRNDIIKSYNVLGDVQIVRVPSYNSALIETELTCAPWDSTRKTGGILTMIVGTKLTLNANINVKAKGFVGGAAVEGAGNCIESAVNLNNYFYPAVFTNSGLKGESHIFKAYIDASIQYPIYPGYAKGMGASFTGGGGGNGRFSGGGGGSLFGTGGKGGLEQNFCSNREFGGQGGKSVRMTLPLDGIFLGGGGGGSTHLPGATTSPGGNGGGIVIILCETLDGNGYSIIADGETPGTASGNAGSGGGGGGGSIALYLQGFSETPLTISAKGGNGGNNEGQFGEGGGGGGGLINISNITIPENISSSRYASGGSYGKRFGTGHEATSGTLGDNITTFVPSLNGFLFNSIYSSVTLNQVDSICSNRSFGQISGTLPVGGTTPLTYLWEFSTISDVAGFNAAPGTNNLQNYTPPDFLTQTTWFRRKITDSGIPVIEDISKPVKVIVQPFIKNNIIGKPDTVCYNGDPPLIQQLAPALADGNGRYSYIWQVSTDNSIFGASVASTSDYDPPSGLDKTSWYRRTVISGRCIDLTAVAIMTVLDTISKNIITTPPDTICHGGVFANLVTDPALGGGDGTYSYLWESSSDGSTWGTATGITNLSAYDPDELSAAFPGKEFYRRKVFSGIHNVCINTSKPVGIVDWPVITNNSIAADQTICSSDIPVPLSGSLPLNGSGVYKYTWQDSSKVHNWLDIPGFVKVTNKDFSPPSLADSTGYKRIVTSSKCSSVSKSVIINVHKPIINNIASLISDSGSDTTICSGAVPNLIKGSPPSGGTNIPGDYAYQWLYSTDNLSYSEIAISGNNAWYQPVSLTDSTWFKRKVLSGECISESNIIRIIVLPEITNNVISTDQTVCYGTIPSTITGSVLTGGAGGTPTWLWQESSDGGNTWGTAAGTSSQQNYSPPALTSPIRYRRIILSGLYNCCIDTSNFVSIGIYALPAGTITSVDDITICNGTEVPLNIHLTDGSTPWKVVFSAGSSTFAFNNISVADTTIKVISSITESTANVIYSFASVQDKNNCFATSLTGSRKAIVYRVPVANAGSDNSVCGPQYTLSATPSVGAGKWIFPSQVVFSTTNDPVVTVKIDSSFTLPEVSYKFYWEETNWLCVNKDSVTITFNRRIKPVSAGSDTTIYSFDNLTQLNATPLQPGETGSWSVISGTGDFDDYNNSSTFVRNVSKGSNTYLWSVINGECKLEDLVRVDVMGLEIPQGFSPNDDPGNYNNTFVINGLDLRKKWVAPDSVPAFQHAHLSILNGAGTQVFSTTNRDGNEWKNWDGKNSKGFDLSEGTYYYLLKITSLGTGQVFKKSGFIILKRY